MGVYHDHVACIRAYLFAHTLCDMLEYHIHVINWNATCWKATSKGETLKSVKIIERNEFVVNIWKDKLSICQCNGIICFDLISQNIIVYQDKVQS